MRVLKLSYYGVSGFIILFIFLCGVMVRFILDSDLPFSVKLFSGSLLVLVFVNDQEKMLTENVRK